MGTAEKNGGKRPGLFERLRSEMRPREIISSGSAMTHAPYHYVYVLRSRRDHNFYVGYTRKLPVRVNQHNAGFVTSTKNRTPLELVYWEGCLHQQDATRREKYLKSAWGKRYIKNRLKNCLTG